jgi:hypothetical protein
MSTQNKLALLVGKSSALRAAEQQTSMKAGNTNPTSWNARHVGLIFAPMKIRRSI